jgi:hypothetical protein
LLARIHVLLDYFCRTANADTAFLAILVADKQQKQQARIGYACALSQNIDVVIGTPCPHALPLR